MTDDTLPGLLAAVGTKESLLRLQQHLDSLPFPHYAADPVLPGVFLRTIETGEQTRGKFLGREFVEL